MRHINACTHVNTLTHTNNMPGSKHAHTYSRKYMFILKFSFNIDLYNIDLANFNRQDSHFCHYITTFSHFESAYMQLLYAIVICSCYMQLLYAVVIYIQLVAIREPKAAILLQNVDLEVPSYSGAYLHSILKFI